MKQTNYKTILKGVSTLDIMKKNHTSIFFLLVIFAFSSTAFSRVGHSTLDLVDPSFAPNVQSAQYGNKIVHKLQSLPDGKILALGNFTSYNRVPVGFMVRLNADGSLDPTFYTQAIISYDVAHPSTKIVLQSDGKIVVMGVNIIVGVQCPQVGIPCPKRLVRLNADGTLDTDFNYTLGGSPRDVFIDSVGRIALSGSFQTPQGSRQLIRLNANGSLDTSFNFVPDNGFGLNVDNVAAQGSRLLVFTFGNQVQKLYRLDDNGAPDTTFTAINFQTGISNLTVQTDNKIMYLAANDKIRRLNADGSVDNDFQPITPPPTFGLPVFKIADDGKIVVAGGEKSWTFYRFLSDGVSDPSFNPYTPQSYTTFTIQPDGGIIIGDMSNPNAVILLNNFVRLLPENGMLDPAFNPGGGIGFQIILPGSIRAIETQTDGKILLGGKFDLINDIPRYRLARLNADSTVDSSFQINTATTGNYFSIIKEIYQIRVQSDGKVVVSGLFDYIINGVTKKNFVRLNSDGSIDGTFIISENIPDYVVVNNAGRNRFLTLDGGKVMIGTSRISNDQANGPLKFNDNGTRDTSFNSMLHAESSLMFIDDLAIQPDGKILVSGTYSSLSGTKTFLARLNPDGSLDSTFSYTEEPDRIKSLLALLPNGKILIAKYGGISAATIKRLNSDGSVDNSFNTVSIPNAVINALLVLPNGKIFVGGSFTLTVGGQPAKNLLQLDADGNFEPTLYNLNEEVLALAVDGEGRLLVGGEFTVIGTNGGSDATRSYVARLTDSPARFDFDGDGRSDLGTFTDSNGVWNILQSGNNQAAVSHFGLSGDKIAPADYDGDGRADIAVFRPSNGVWYLLKSRDGFGAIQWGLAEDKPVAADYDGDGLADIAVWRPSNRVWYVLQSSNGQVFSIQFGLSDDIPLADADFDGDGKADIAVWRPSNGVFYWLASGSGNQFRAVQWGQAGDIPVVGDFNGDGKTDLVVFRPTDGNWYQLLTQPNGDYAVSIFNFGLNGDEPVAADYDGDGKTDIAVRRQNIWHIQRSGQGYISVAFAEADDLAVASSLNR